MAKVFVLGGPTGTGKSDLAVHLAREFGACVVSADAMTVYRGLDIGTAKPSDEILEEIPHYAVNVRGPEEEFSVADFCRVFERACAEHRKVIVAGGTPFYLSALFKPLANLPPANPEVRKAIERLDDLHAALTLVDPVTAERVHPNDKVRLVRALEVFELTGRPLSRHHQEGPGRAPVDAPMCWIDRQSLRDRIRLRLEAMVAGGYLGEVRSLCDRFGNGSEVKPMRSFAYRYFVAHIRGEMGLDEAFRLTERDTWRFARKQRGWARSMGWSAIPPDEARVLGQDILR